MDFFEWSVEVIAILCIWSGYVRALKVIAAVKSERLKLLKPR